MRSYWSNGIQVGKPISESIPSVYLFKGGGSGDKGTATALYSPARSDCQRDYFARYLNSLGQCSTFASSISMVLVILAEASSIEEGLQQGRR